MDDAMRLRVITFLTLLTPIVCLAGVPESIVGKWQFDSVRTASGFIDQVQAANPGAATPAQIAEQKSEFAKYGEQADRQLTATITSDTIRMVNKRGEPTFIAYKVIGGNSRLVILDATSAEIGNAVINIRLVEGGIAIETLDCQSQPDVCERMREQQRRRAESTSNKTVAVVSAGPGAPSAERPGPTQPQWIYFRSFPSSPVEK